jgi:hypothetical protein
MAERAVDLPKPHPDDDEDVVDWLSTAQTLWARGERADALVWLRRAAEAAAMAGQPFRASEIGMYVTALEETFGELPAPRLREPQRAVDTQRTEEPRRDPEDTLVDTVEAFGALASEVLRAKLASIEVNLEEDTLTEDAPAALVAEHAPPDPPPAFKPQPPPSREAHEPKVILRTPGASVPPGAHASAAPPPATPSTGSSARPPPPAPSAGGSARPPPPAPSAGGSAWPPAAAPAGRPLSAPPPGFMPAIPAPRTPEGEEITLVSADFHSATVSLPSIGASPSFGKSPLAATPTPSAVRAVASGLPPPPPSFGAPLPVVPRPPPTPSGASFGASGWGTRSDPPPPKPGLPSSAPPPSWGTDAASAPRAPMGSAPNLGSTPPSHPRALQRRTQRKPRAPILDPWAEDQVTASGVGNSGPKAGSEEVVVVRARFPSLHDDDEVFTSAAPLPPALRRRDPATIGASAPPLPVPAPPPAPVAPVAPPVSISPMVSAHAAPPPPPVPPPQPGRLANTADVPPKSVPPPAKIVAPPAPPTSEPLTKPSSLRPPSEPLTKPSGEPSIKPPAEPSLRPEPLLKPPVEPLIKPPADKPPVELSVKPPADKPPVELSVKPPADKPSVEPSIKLPSEPVTKPSAEPLIKSSVEPLTKPSAEPSFKPPSEPLTKPSAEPSFRPPSEPLTKPSAEPLARFASQPPGKVARPSSPAGAPRPVAVAKLSASTPPPPGSPAAAKVGAVAASASLPSKVAAPAAPKARPATVPPAPPVPVMREPTASSVEEEWVTSIEQAPVTSVEQAPVTSMEPAALTSSDDSPVRPKFDPARATLPMMMEIEPSPVGTEMPSMRATIPMPMELPQELAALLTVGAEPPLLLEGTRLSEVDAFNGMPRAVHELLLSKVEIVKLGTDEEVSGFGGALLLSGSAIVCATIVDAAAHWARPCELLAVRGSLADGIALRVVGAGSGATVAVWSRAALDEAFSAQAGSGARARARGDRLQALAGATMGPFGEIADEDRRALAEELVVRCLRPGEIWLEDGAQAPAIAMVGAGEIELYGPISEETSEAIEPGGLVFPELVLAGGDAPSSVRAGAHGALLLIADGDAAKKMTARVPDLAARLRG